MTSFCCLCNESLEKKVLVNMSCGKIEKRNIGFMFNKNGELWEVCRLCTRAIKRFIIKERYVYKAGYRDLKSKSPTRYKLKKKELIPIVERLNMGGLMIKDRGDGERKIEEAKKEGFENPLLGVHEKPRLPTEEEKVEEMEKILAKNMS